MSAAGEDIAAALTRTEREYDALPYQSRPFAHSHPGRVAAIARLLGIDPPCVETARVLELGCAAGGNLIPVAAHFPQAQCLGIDISQVQTDVGNRRIAALGLGNVMLRQASITDLTPELGKFDYVIAHGVYSWVPAPVRRGIWRVLEQSMAPDGVAYLSYNVLPGWRLHQPFRDALRVMVPERLGEQQRTAVGRQLIAMMGQHTVNREEYGAFMRRYAAHLLDRPPELLFHDFMEADNEPFLFSDILVQARRHGLDYLGDAAMAGNVPTLHGQDYARELAERSGGVTAVREQLHDILSGRTFRRSLLTRGDSAGAIDHQGMGRRLAGMHLMIAASATITIAGTTAQVDNGQGIRGTIEGAVPVHALSMLIEGAPGSVAFDRCVGGFGTTDRDLVADAMASLVASETLLASTVPMESAAATTLPCATRLARGDATAGEALTANPRHEAVSIDPVMAILLPALDGTNGPAELAALMAQAVRDGRLEVETDGGPGMLEASILAALPELLSDLAGKGLLAA